MFYIAETTLPSCETESQPACLEDNLSGLENGTRTRLHNWLQSLEPVLNTSCSVNLKKFACFIRTVPCVTDAGSLLDSCQSLCEEVRLNCGKDLKIHNVFFPQCVPNYPEVDVGSGLCSLTHWPVSWPPPAKINQNPGLCNNILITIRITLFNNNDIRISSCDFKLEFYRETWLTFYIYCIIFSPHRV